MRVARAAAAVAAADARCRRRRRRRARRASRPRPSRGRAPAGPRRGVVDVRAALQRRRLPRAPRGCARVAGRRERQARVAAEEDDAERLAAAGARRSRARRPSPRRSARRACGSLASMTSTSRTCARRRRRRARRAGRHRAAVLGHADVALAQSRRAGSVSTKARSREARWRGLRELRAAGGRAPCGRRSGERGQQAGGESRRCGVIARRSERSAQPRRGRHRGRRAARARALELGDEGRAAGRSAAGAPRIVPSPVDRVDLEARRGPASVMTSPSMRWTSVIARDAARAVRRSRSRWTIRSSAEATCWRIARIGRSKPAISTIVSMRASASRGRVGVHGRQRAVVAGVHRLQHVERLGAADLADDDPVGPHAQRVAHQVADRRPRPRPRCSAGAPRAAPRGAGRAAARPRPRS